MSIKVTRGTGVLQHVIEARGHRTLVDVPESFDGGDSGPTPHELLEGALGACTALTVTLYARRKQWPLDDVVVEVDHETDAHGAFLLKRQIRYHGKLSREQKTRLTEIANACPVHRILSGSIRIETSADLADTDRLLGFAVSSSA